MSDETPKWFENDDEADAFIDKNRGKLIDKLGLGDLFAGDDPPKASGATAGLTGAGTASKSSSAEPVSVPSNQSQDVMGHLVRDAIGALKEAAVAKSTAPASSPPTPPKTRRHWLLGDILDD